MRVLIKEREGAKGTSLFLRWWNPSRKKYEHEFLKFCLTGNKVEDKERRRLAEVLRIKKEGELIADSFGTVPFETKKTPFIDYYKQVKKNKGWEKVLCHLITFPRREIPLNQINENWVREIRDYLLTRPGVSQNSAHYYYTKIKTCLNVAHRERIIDYKFHDNVDPIKVIQKKIDALTQTEIELLAKTPMKTKGGMETARAFLFSCFTGLRYSDIRKLTFGEIDFVKNEIYLVQQKTGSIVTIPLLQQAKDLALKNTPKGTTPLPSNLVFPDFSAPVNVNRDLKKWNKSIKTSIHFHLARASFASNIYEKTEDVYAVSKLLGHSKISTTEKYLKVSPKKLQTVIQTALGNFKIS